MYYLRITSQYSLYYSNIRRHIKYLEISHSIRTLATSVIDIQTDCHASLGPGHFPGNVYKNNAWPWRFTTSQYLLQIRWVYWRCNSSHGIDRWGYWEILILCSLIRARRNNRIDFTFFVTLVNLVSAVYTYDASWYVLWRRRVSYLFPKIRIVLWINTMLYMTYV